MRFNIKLEKNRFELINFSLADLEINYLQSYLDKINNYKKIGTVATSPLFSLYQPPIATLAGIRSLDNRLLRKFNRITRPATATISLTKKCQCECEHCSAFFYNHSLKRELTTLEMKNALKETVDLGVTTIILLGGEPLLHKGIFELIDSVPKDLATVILFTNGEYLNKENCIKLKQAGLLGAFVSLDSIDLHEHDTLRRRSGLFSKALNGIRAMNDIGLISGISSYLTSQRLKNGVFEETLDFAKNNEVREVTFFDAIPSGKWLREELGLLSASDRVKIEELVRCYRKKLDYPGLSVQSSLTSECGSAFCFAANTQFYLTAFGEMCPCDFTPISFGKYPDHSIKYLWKKMISTAPYNKRAKSCRMQDSRFREKYIYNIPSEGPFPYPIENFVDRPS